MNTDEYLNHLRNVRLQTIMTKIRTICCECGEIVHDGPQLEHESSHGLCGRCYGVILAFLEGRPYDREYAKKITCIGN